MIDQTVTRQVFEGLSSAGEALFYLAAAVATLVFLVGTGIKLRKYLHGQREDRIGSREGFLRGVIQGATDVAANTTVRKRDRYAGLAHAAIMWGFIVLFLGTVILTIDTDFAPLLGPDGHFFWGAFYLGYSLVLDVLGLAMLIGIGAMAWRRARLHTPQLDYRRVDIAPATSDRRGFVAGDWIFLAWLATLGVTGFLVESVRIVAHGFPWFEVFSPVGWLLGGLLATLGLTAGTAATVHLGLWWSHAAIALSFVAYIPFSKAVHMLSDPVNLGLRSPLAGRRLPVLPAVPTPDGHLGLRDTVDLSWKQLVDLDACTRCGRCHAACPAVASGAPLSPRDLVLDLRQQVDAEWAVLAPLHEQRSDRAYGPVAGTAHDNGNGNGTGTGHDHGHGPGDGDGAGDGAQAATGPAWTGNPVAGGLISSQTLWSCTTCLACVEACPVGIEHVPMIVGMRRSLVDQAEVEPGLQTAFTNLAKQGNSFGQSGRTRGRWTEGLPTPIVDARREDVDWLWFVGDFASFDVRVQEATRLVARVFQAAGLDFGILYEGERNAGNDIRRAGEEGLFELLVEHNVGQLSKARFKRIVTTDPHTLNTLRFEYPQFGGSYAVWHYTQLLAALFEDGHLSVRQPVGRRVTYHDPCYLARYSEVTRAPREVLDAIGAELVEMPRNRANTFCCGAGGGRIWMDDSGLSERPSEQRIREAAGLENVTDFITACPKDLTMYTAAAKATGHDGSLAVADVIELVAAAINLQSAAADAAEPAADEARDPAPVAAVAATPSGAPAVGEP